MNQSTKKQKQHKKHLGTTSEKFWKYVQWKEWKISQGHAYSGS